MLHNTDVLDTKDQPAQQHRFSDYRLRGVACDVCCNSDCAEQHKVTTFLGPKSKESVKVKTRRRLLSGCDAMLRQLFVRSRVIPVPIWPF